MDISYPISPETRRQGFIAFNLISHWDDWVKRRVEHVELVDASMIRRRISIDFRLHAESFGNPAVSWGDDEIHFVPLTLLEKAPFTHFDLRDEDGTALPLLTRRKTSAMGAIVLASAAQVAIVRRFLKPGAKKNSALFEAIAERRLRIDQIEIPRPLEELFRRACYEPYQRPSSESDKATAPQTWAEQIGGWFDGQVTGGEWPDVTHWKWLHDSGMWTAPRATPGDWLTVLLEDDAFAQLAFDFSRLFMVCAPVVNEPGRRRILKIQYDEPLIEPGLRELAAIRRNWIGLARTIRRREDRREGLDHKPATAIASRLRGTTNERREQLKAERQRAGEEWILPESTSNRRFRERPSVRTKVGRGIGRVSKPMTLELPGLGFGGTYHFEFSAPEGTQIRRARLRAQKPTAQGAAFSGRFARRFARDVTRCHLYLGELRQGQWGDALIAIRPKSSTVIRGAAMASALIFALIMFAILIGGDLAKRPATVISLAFLAPGLTAALLARPNEHPVTTGMLFGIRLLSLSVAAVAVAAAVLLGARQTVGDLPGAWIALAVVALLQMLTLLEAWRLAGRDWPRSDEI